MNAIRQRLTKTKAAFSSWKGFKNGERLRTRAGLNGMPRRYCVLSLRACLTLQLLKSSVPMALRKKTRLDFHGRTVTWTQLPFLYVHPLSVKRPPSGANRSHSPGALGDALIMPRFVHIL